MEIDLRHNLSGEEKCSCGNCNWADHPIDDAEPINHPEQRLTPGDPIPVGQCPSCGALVYIVEKKPGKNPV